MRWAAARARRCTCCGRRRQARPDSSRTARGRERRGAGRNGWARWKRKRGALQPQQRPLLRLAGCRFPPRPHPEAVLRATSPLSGPLGKAPCSERRSQGQVGLRLGGWVSPEDALFFSLFFFAGDQRWVAELLAVARGQQRVFFRRPGFCSSHLLTLTFHLPFTVVGTSSGVCVGGGVVCV